MTNPAKKLWIENMRPQHVADCILPEETKSQILKFVEEGECPHLMFCGSPGTGKTSTARALANDLGCDFMLINASEESGIDVIRNKIKSFASTVSVVSDTKHKIVCLDEADYFNPNSSQPALRGLMEEFWNNCRFILTCNLKNRIIPALHSRCTVVDFTVTGEEKKQMMAEYFKRVEGILKSNHVKYDKKVLVRFIMQYFPDLRRMLNELQRYSTAGVIDEGILKAGGTDLTDQIIKFLREKNFREMRTWVDENANIDQAIIFNKLYDELSPSLVPQTIPNLILILDEYQFKAASVVNPRINLAACFVHLMSELEFA